MTLKTTYNDLIRRMKNKFYEECGEDCDDLGDISIRFQCVATELYALSTFQNYLEKQLFVSTASGENLDIQGSLSGVERKTPSYAQGELTFSVSEAAEADINIPKGTVCSKNDEPYVQFNTTENAVISEGQTSVTVGAVSLRQASNANAPEKTVTVIVNPPAGVETVVNEAAFTGGCDMESDEAFRARILALREVPPNGVNAASLASVIEKDDRVLSCLVTGCDQEGKVRVYLKTRDGNIDETLRETVNDVLGICALAGCVIEIEQAIKKEAKVVCNARVYQFHDIDAVTQEIKSVIEEYCSVCAIGKVLSLEGVLPRLSEIDGVAECQIYSPSEQNGEIACGTGEYIFVSAVEVNCYE